MGALLDTLGSHREHAKGPRDHVRGSKGPWGHYKRVLGVCLACAWRVPGITGGRGRHDKREDAPPIKVDAP